MGTIVPILNPLSGGRHRESFGPPPGTGSPPGQHPRRGVAGGLAADRRRAPCGARALVADAAHAVPVRLALLVRAQPRPPALALAGAGRRAGGDARRLGRVPDAVRPPAGNPAADAVRRPEAAR